MTIIVVVSFLIQFRGITQDQQPIFAHAPNLSFHSCLYFSHHSSSQFAIVSPHTMILKRACSSAVHATPSNSPLVTGAWLRSRPAEAKSGSRNKVMMAEERMSLGAERVAVQWKL